VFKSFLSNLKFFFVFLLVGVGIDALAQESDESQNRLPLNHQALKSEVEQRFKNESRTDRSGMIPLKGQASKFWIRYRGYQKKDSWNKRYSIIQKGRNWALEQSIGFLLRVLKSEKDVLLQKAALESIAGIKLFEAFKKGGRFSSRFLASTQQSNRLSQEVKLIRLAQYRLSRLLADKNYSPGFRLEVSETLQNHLSQLLDFMSDPPDELSKRNREALVDAVLAAWFGLKRVESRNHLDEFFLPVGRQISEISTEHEEVLRDLIPSSVLTTSPGS
jgi:hypothetical protein